MDILTGIGIFLAILLLIEGGYALFRVINDPGRRRVKRRLQHLSVDSSGFEPESLGPVVKPAESSSVAGTDGSCFDGRPDEITLVNQGPAVPSGSSCYWRWYFLPQVS
jgi:hypothetical protein